jgi:hypothetical protein
MLISFGKEKAAQKGKPMVFGTKPKASSKAMLLATIRSQCLSKPKALLRFMFQTIVEARGTLAISSPSSFITRIKFSLRIIVGFSVPILWAMKLP